MDTSKKLILVGSLNPVKINAVRLAVNQVWPDTSWQVEGVSVPSGVADQPMSDSEAIKGARHRAIQALTKKSNARYGVGIEGGIQQIDDLWFDCGWIVIRDQTGAEGIGSTARIITPPKMMALIHQGQELGAVVDVLFKTTNAKQAEGHFGLMTHNHITRTSGYKDGVIMALVRFLQPHLF